MLLFNFIKAAQFFPKYAPGVTNWINKARGKNGRGNPITFTKADLVKIEKGLVAMHKASLAEVLKTAAGPKKKKAK